MRISNINNINFEAMKPNQFKGVDYACVRKFKAPVEKFNTEKNFYFWAQDKISQLVKQKNIPGKSSYTIAQRRDLILEWRQALGYHLVEAPFALIALSSILKDLKATNDNLPPVFVPEILEDTMKEINTNLNLNKDFQFNFNDLYCKKLTESFLEKQDFTGWVKIPSIENAPLNFRNNVDKLKVFSNKTWCTKSVTAEVLLKHGDIHIWLEDGMPKLALRFKEHLLTEIRNELNKNVLTPEKFKIVQDYIIQNNFAMEGLALDTYQRAKKLSETLQKLKSTIGEDNLNNNYEIFKYFGYAPIKLEDNSISLNEYKMPIEKFNFVDLGFDETKLFENVAEIRGNANFKASSLKELKHLKRILGNANFIDSQIKKLGELESIQGHATFTNSQIFSTGNLKYIGGIADFRDSNVRVLENIEIIGKDLYLNPHIFSLGKLKCIGGKANFPHFFSALENLEVIGGDAFFGAGIKGLGKLHTIKGNAYFMYSQLDTLGNLKYIGGTFYPGENMTPDKYSHIKINNIVINKVMK